MCFGYRAPDPPPADIPLAVCVQERLFSPSKAVRLHNLKKRQNERRAQSAGNATELTSGLSLCSQPSSPASPLGFAKAPSSASTAGTPQYGRSDVRSAASARASPYSLLAYSPCTLDNGATPLSDRSDGLSPMRSGVDGPSNAWDYWGGELPSPTVRAAQAAPLFPSSSIQSGAATPPSARRNQGGALPTTVRMRMRTSGDAAPDYGSSLGRASGASTPLGSTGRLVPGATGPRHQVSGATAAQGAGDLATPGELRPCQNPEADLGHCLEVRSPFLLNPCMRTDRRSLRAECRGTLGVGHLSARSAARHTG